METFLGLYRILVAVSAAALMLGLVLLFKTLKELNNSKKHLYILAVVNVVSMLTFLFNFNNGYTSGWKEVIIFLESVVLVLNLIMGYFVYQSWEKPSVPFSKQIMTLFLVCFLSVCVYVTTYYATNSTGPIFDKNNTAFISIYSLSLFLYLFGSLVPAIKVVKQVLIDKQPLKMILLIVVINGLNNTVGLIFFVGEIPNKQTGIVLNIFFNLLFAYTMAYFFLSEYFNRRKSTSNQQYARPSAFSWDNMRSHLNYWGELKDYLNDYYPEIIDEVDPLPLTELEKTHLVLKKLNIKAKDIANAMNVSVKAIEMNRYRIKRKLEGSEKV